MTADSFELFFKDAEPRLHDALPACFGSELGREATADALAYGWEHWDRVASMENPIGYLFVVGRDRGRKARGRRRARLPLVEESRLLRRRDFDIPPVEGLFVAISDESPSIGPIWIGRIEP